jgi:hypothetical protein
MLVHNKPSAAARMALAYITLGALTVIWTGVWWAYLRTQEVASVNPYYYCVGLMLTGFTLLVIGLALGRIGRAARPADVGGVEVPGHGTKPAETVPVTAAPAPPPAPPGTAAPSPPTAIPALVVPINPASANGLPVASVAPASPGGVAVPISPAPVKSSPADRQPVTPHKPA